ncbi:MAG: ATPase domain-containing protein [Candidatus Aenigmatarchaeota archaeon]
MVIERISTGIEELDKLLEGGFVKGSCILVSGYPGSGKTIFGFQFLIEGLKRGENAIYFTLEESKQDLLEDVERFGWKEFLLEKEKEGKFLIQEILPSSIDKISAEIIRYVNLIKPQRVVIDSVTLIENSWESYQEVGKIRRSIFNIVKDLKNKKITLLLLSEAKKDEISFEEFLADGVIKLYYLTQSLPRAMQISKMRKTKHTLDLIPFEITDRGIVIKRLI